VSTIYTSKDDFMFESQFNDIEKNNFMLRAYNITWPYYGK